MGIRPQLVEIALENFSSIDAFDKLLLTSVNFSFEHGILPSSDWTSCVSLTLTPHMFNPFLSVQSSNDFLLLVALRICSQLDEERMPILIYFFFYLPS